MGTVRFTIRDFYDQSSELVGIKSSLLLSDLTIQKILKETFQDEFLSEDNHNYFIRLRAEEIEEMIRYIRQRIGNVPPHPNENYYMFLLDNLGQNDFNYLYNKYIMHAISCTQKREALDYKTLKVEVKKEKHLSEKEVDALVYIVMERIDNSIIIPDSKLLDNNTPLENLFNCELFPESSNTFIDQKFIDYLAVNGNEIEQIHWRNFEKFTAEYFQRKGLKVILGPGGNDGGVDIRVYNEKNSTDPFILIQCKRYKTENKVAIETVKAFHSDVVFENAKLGLIATTSQIAPGGKKVVTARDYNVTFAENEKIKKWATTMWKF